MSQIDLNKYKEFVRGVTSSASNETVELCNRLEALEKYVEGREKNNCFRVHE